MKRIVEWKWTNVPIPAQHLVGLILGAILTLVFKQRLFAVPWIGDVLGLPLIAVGVGLSAWSVLEAGDTEIESPNRLFTGGPYTLSRNPMYVAWTLMYLGIGLTANSLWIIALLPIVVAFTHFVDVRREERFLEKQFGDEYLQYKGQVRRYF
jgi:protein-S-isoprenylcysteine O-methyltransferase Ste14